MTIVLATHNPSKMEEMSNLLDNLPLKVKTLKDFTSIGDIPETGLTLKENAFIKAQTVNRLTGLPSLADDTGLEVEALNGSPGIFSARYAGENATYKDNCKKLLNNMKNIKESERQAEFRTVIAFVDGQQELWAEGTVKGLISKKEKGANGFGYDSIFYYPPYKKTFAEMKNSDKNNISHRSKALRNFIEIFEKRLNY